MDAITITAAMNLTLYDTNIGGGQYIYNTKYNNNGCNYNHSSNGSLFIRY